MVTTATASTADSFKWQPQPQAAALVERLIEEVIAKHSRLAAFRDTLRQQTGTRLLDWVDHLVVPNDESLAVEALRVGYEIGPDLDTTVWRHAAGMFPPLVVADVRMHGELTAGLGIKVEEADFFLKTHGIPLAQVSHGSPGAPLRVALIEASGTTGFWIVERHGFSGFTPPTIATDQIDLAERHFQRFQSRPRAFPNAHEGFEHARQLIREAQHEIGVDWATDRFFAAERMYWQSRNRAAQTQYARQQKLGLGWANHDHHTYRSSRECFGELVATLELLGFQCRERFYAGQEAGWGAQVLEQRQCGLCVFADVDLSPDEVAGDFAHQPLPARDALGTVGLWCALHGEAFLEAGMHHLEAQFEFDTAREQLQQVDVNSMAPFTDLPYLRQAFTVGERWQVAPARIDKLLAAGKISADQAERFRREGAIGSHLEVLQREEGYKGFNQTGISDIISRTDPRRAS